MVTISYCITACNEHEELGKLLHILKKKINPEDEIVIQVDSVNVTNEVLNIAEQAVSSASNVKLVKFSLNKDFASFKNNANTYCTKDFIFQIDADEFPDDVLLENIHSIIESNDQVDLFVVPRKNTVEGLTQAHIQKWGWQVNENMLVNWPDYQTRIYKRNRDIRWQRKVHEYISGYKRMSYLPDIENMNLCLHHPKTIERQEKQNKFYESI
jgi:glycosyltransferase involved in cell wall biosynthesis